jgi:hypothetical protein
MLPIILFEKSRRHVLLQSLLGPVWHLQLTATGQWRHSMDPADLLCSQMGTMPLVRVVGIASAKLLRRELRQPSQGAATVRSPMEMVWQPLLVRRLVLRLMHRTMSMWETGETIAFVGLHRQALSRLLRGRDRVVGLMEPGRMLSLIGFALLRLTLLVIFLLGTKIAFGVSPLLALSQRLQGAEMRRWSMAMGLPHHSM